MVDGDKGCIAGREEKKSRIWETLNISTDEDSITIAMKRKKNLIGSTGSKYHGLTVLRQRKVLMRLRKFLRIVCPKKKKVCILTSFFFTHIM